MLGGVVLGGLQGSVNIVNGLQDIAIGLMNLPALLTNGIASLEESAGILPEGSLRVPYIASPDWSYGLITEEDALAHDISKFVGSSGLLLGYSLGAEISLFSGNFRLAPFGNRTGHAIGRFPHYHRRGPFNPVTGETIAGQGIGRHRPWELKIPDLSFWNRF
jgi:hypothetical protein